MGGKEDEESVPELSGAPAGGFTFGVPLEPQQRGSSQLETIPDGVSIVSYVDAEESSRRP